MSKRYKITNGKWLRTSCSMSHPYYYMRTGCKIKRTLNQGFVVYEELQELFPQLTRVEEKLIHSIFTKYRRPDFHKTRPRKHNKISPSPEFPDSPEECSCLFYWINFNQIESRIFFYMIYIIQNYIFFIYFLTRKVYGNFCMSSIFAKLEMLPCYYAA